MYWISHNGPAWMRGGGFFLGARLPRSRQIALAINVVDRGRWPGMDIVLGDAT